MRVDKKYLFFRLYEDFDIKPGIKARSFNVWATKIRTGQRWCLKNFKSKSSACQYVSMAMRKKKHGFISNRIGEVCKSKGISIKSLSNMLNMKNPNSLQVMAYNGAQPGIGLLSEISSILKVPVDELVIR
mgnify:CR=1 FL=1